MKRVAVLFFLALIVQSCGSDQNSVSQTANFLEGGGWKIAESPYNLAPGSTIAICDRQKTGISKLVIAAVREWLKAGGRDERILVHEACSGSRVIILSKLTQEVDFFGRAHPLSGNIYNIDVPKQWAGHWTANHEVGHVFGFAHIFDGVVSIMNSENNGQYMNNGQLSAYDRSEVKRMLSLPHFKAVNALWKAPVAAPAAAPVPAPVAPHKKACIGVDGSTSYPHAVVTLYQGQRFLCDNGKWSNI